MKRFKSLKLAKAFAQRSKTYKWIFDNENQDGYIVVGSKMAQELTDAGLRAIYGPFNLIGGMRW